MSGHTGCFYSFWLLGTIVFSLVFGCSASDSIIYIHVFFLLQYLYFVLVFAEMLTLQMIIWLLGLSYKRNKAPFSKILQHSYKWKYEKKITSTFLFFFPLSRYNAIFTRHFMWLLRVLTWKSWCTDTVWSHHCVMTRGGK